MNCITPALVGIKLIVLLLIVPNIPINGWAGVKLNEPIFNELSLVYPNVFVVLSLKVKFIPERIQRHVRFWLAIADCKLKSLNLTSWKSFCADTSLNRN